MSGWLVVVTGLYVCVCICFRVYVNLCNFAVKPKFPILRHVCISMKSHITIDSGSDKPIHTCRKHCLHAPLKMGFSPWPVQGFYFTYQCDRQEVASIASGQVQDNVILFWVIIPPFCSMSAIKWCVHGASTHTPLGSVVCVCHWQSCLFAKVPWACVVCVCYISALGLCCVCLLSALGFALGTSLASLKSFSTREECILYSSWQWYLPYTA